MKKNSIFKHYEKKKKAKNFPKTKAFVQKNRTFFFKRFFTTVKGVLLIFIISILFAILLIPALTVSFYQKETTSRANEVPQDKIDPPKEDDMTIAVFRTETENVEEVPLETYVSRVVASEMPPSFELEALKAQSIAARTYIIDHILHKKDAEILDDENDQVYKNEEELREIWGKDFHKNIEKLQKAVQATKGKIITYHNQPITAAYFSTSNGYTENSEDYWEQELPYLRSVESPWDKQSPKFTEQTIYPRKEIEQKLNITVPKNAVFEISRTNSNRVKQVEVNGEKLTGREIREKLSLPSSDFSIKQNDEYIIFMTKGFGHGIGMSQYGANGMAKEGKSFEDIIHHYYQDVTIQSVQELDDAIQTTKLKK